MRKILRVLSLLTSKSDRDDDNTKELKEKSRELQQFCDRNVAGGEVPNPLKLLQTHFKHVLLTSEKMKGESPAHVLVQILAYSSELAFFPNTSCIR